MRGGANTGVAVEGWRSLRNRAQGAVEGVSSCRYRATALILAKDDLDLSKGAWPAFGASSACQRC
jgi:hypothetical protein